MYVIQFQTVKFDSSVMLCCMQNLENLYFEIFVIDSLCLDLFNFWTIW